jgi:hypothetical protein
MTMPPLVQAGGNVVLEFTGIKGMLLVEEMQIGSFRISDIVLGKSIYPKKQLDKFATFQDSQGTRANPWQKQLNWPI